MLIGALADHLLLKPHSTSEHVDRLVKLGLVSRASGLADRRQVGVVLTAEGRKILATLSVVHREELRRIRPLLTQLITRL
jgi:DNA-binding MarR family transcriptional regulator